MAYSVELAQPRCACGKPARVEVKNRYNSSVGKFCKRCGARVLRELKQAEDRALK